MAYSFIVSTPSTILSLQMSDSKSKISSKTLYLFFLHLKLYVSDTAFTRKSGQYQRLRRFFTSAAIVLSQKLEKNLFAKTMVPNNGCQRKSGLMGIKSVRPAAGAIQKASPGGEVATSGPGDFNILRS